MLIGLGSLALLAGATGLVATRLPASAPQEMVTLATSSPTPSATQTLMLPGTSPARAATNPSASRSSKAGQPATPALATPVARISIPRIGIKNAPIYDEATDSRGDMLIASGYAVTHYASSASFGTGNAVLYGHDDIQGNIFSHLYDLTAGDIIQISDGRQMQRYRVTGHQIVPPSALGVLNPTPDVRLTIITCWPYNVDTKRWIVTAVLA